MHQLVHGGAIPTNALRHRNLMHGTILKSCPNFLVLEQDFMLYVYILSCADRRLYVGFTSDLKERIARHKNGQVVSTRPRRPVKLVFYEAYLNKYDALRREKYLKTQKGKQTIKRMLTEYLSDFKKEA